MCLVALAFEAHPRFPLVVAANRDEFFDRAAAPLHWWPPRPDTPQILAGRDLQAGGTWMGVSPAGRLALLTNVRDPARMNPAAPSRGTLVTEWLVGGHSFDAFVEAHASVPYNGFNLLAADWGAGELRWWSNHPCARGASPAAAGGSALAHAALLPPVRLTPGLYGLSNALLDTPWPKVRRLKQRLAETLASAHSTEQLIERLLDALSDPTPAPDEELPRTGVPLEWERWLSSAYIRTPDGRYGTRCSTVLVVEREGGAERALVVERTHPGPGAERAGERREHLRQWPRAGLTRS
ncbi:NRDE family protein [Caldimonas aquatica]|uniref:NRDE family protein n=1 Tax=Caldimonas aquatica TaxID=376175 RepID=A0ABY6MPR4_9BURK|nr:NRDE family protein [Schlegelella aquatica]UZD53622.1 NRDE family protein [Schlegelella aquatica]